MMDLHWTSKIHDAIAAALGGGTILAISILEMDAIVRWMVGGATFLFLVLGAVMRALEIAEKRAARREREREKGGRPR